MSGLMERTAQMTSPEWQAGETYRERHARAVRTLGMPDCHRRLVEAGLDPMLYWRGMGVTKPEPTDDECRRIADALGFPLPDFHPADELEALIRRWAVQRRPTLLVRCTPLPYDPRPDVVVLVEESLHKAPTVFIQPPTHLFGPGVWCAGPALGWPVRLIAYLTEVVPWVRDLHRNGGGR